MSDAEGSGRQTREGRDDNAAQLPPATSSPPGPSEESAFHSQLEDLGNPQLQFAQNVGHYGQQPFEMGAMAGALPHSPQHPMTMHPQYGRAGMPPNLYHMHPAQQFTPGRDTQRTHYGVPPFQQQPHRVQRQPVNIQTQGQFHQMDPYGYGLSPMQLAQIDPRFAPQSPYGLNLGMQGDSSHFMRRASEPAPGSVPSYPRGPPRKPKQSGHALWVGNLPQGATVMELKDHFSRDATKDIDSLFLISKSSCAFVNYRTEEACIAAMERFHDFPFNGVRLVCRLRRAGATTSGAGETPPTPSASESPPIPPSLNVAEESSSSTAVGSTEQIPDRYFIVKSLTTQDLESSVQKGVWATQSHNEDTLNRAYEEADNVYLIFSANKSGEYFGYARMTSPIAGEPVDLSSISAASELVSPGTPQSIPTPATATAPRGWIIDDSARGTIFWEAERLDSDRDESPDKEGGEQMTGQNWGKQFSIEWMSTTRLPFNRTRGLRNPWNKNREVKIARDGTELEPSIGKRLVQMFHRFPQNPNVAQAAAPS